MSDLLITYHFLLPYRNQSELMALSDTGRVALLQEIVRQGPSDDTWNAITELFASWKDSPEKMKALDDANTFMQTWDDRLRHISSAWTHLYKGNGLATVARIAKRISIYRREVNGNMELQKIASSPEAENIVWLEISKSDVYTDSIQQLCTSPYLKNIHTLSFTQLVLSEENTKLLFSTSWPALTRLKMQDTGLTARLIGSLLQAPFITQLKELDVSHNVLNNETASLLAAAQTLSNLELLNLRQNFFDDNGAEILSGAVGLHQLKILNITRNAISAAGIHKLRNAPAFSNTQIIADEKK